MSENSIIFRGLGRPSAGFRELFTTSHSDQIRFADPIELDRTLFNSEKKYYIETLQGNLM